MPEQINRNVWFRFESPDEPELEFNMITFFFSRCTVLL